MPQPRKRTLVLREAGRKSAKAKKLRRALEGEGEGETSDSAPSEAEFSEPEDDFLGQPSDGWKEAERRLRGYSKHTAGNTAQSRYYGRKREEKQLLERKQLTSTYGDISRFFNRCSTATETPSRSATLQPEVIRRETSSSPLSTWIAESDTPSPPPYALAPPPGWQDTAMQLPQSVPIPVSGSQSSTRTADELVLKFRAPLSDFETAFFNSESFEVEVQELDIWLKKSREQVVGDWVKRVQGVRDLLQFQGSFIYMSAKEEEKHKKWREYSECIAVRLEKGPKYAQALRRWERDWFETRTPPPCPMRGKHIKRRCLFTDEGVSHLHAKKNSNTD